MARARNIKPSFFQNESLAELPAEGRLFFVGLWMLCDRDGKMEWRPKRVKAALFPYDEVDVLVFAQELHRRDFVVLYTVDNVDYLKVTNFKKHQHPHQNEKAENLPEPEQSNTLFNIGSGATLVKSESSTGALGPLKESLLRKEERGIGEVSPITPLEKSAPKKFELPEWITPQVWKDFEEHRKKRRAPMTPRAKELIIITLENLREEGYEANACLEQSIRCGWLDVFKIRENQNVGSTNTGGNTGKHQGPRKPSLTETIAEQIAAIK